MFVGAVAYMRRGEVAVGGVVQACERAPADKLSIETRIERPFKAGYRSGDQGKCGNVMMVTANTYLFQTVTTAAPTVVARATPQLVQPRAISLILRVCWNLCLLRSFSLRLCVDVPSAPPSPPLSLNFLGCNWYTLLLYASLYQSAYLLVLLTLDP